MILSGDDIQRALSEGRMVIEPAPSKEDIDTTSIDLRIGEPPWPIEPGPGTAPNSQPNNRHPCSRRSNPASPAGDSL